VIEHLGKGGYGEVKKVHHKLTGQVRAMKIIKVNNDRTNFVSNEITILKELDHPNVLKLYEYFEEKEKVYLIYEYLQGGELFNKVKKEKVLSEMHAA